MTVAMVLIGGAIGAPLRYLTDLFVRSRRESAVPWGTFIVNVAGSLVLGVTAAVATGMTMPSWVLPLVATGFCGALTTFSTFGYETIRLLEEGSTLAAATNSLASLGASLGACAGGYAVTALLV